MLIISGAHVLVYMGNQWSSCLQVWRGRQTQRLHRYRSLVVAFQKLFNRMLGHLVCAVNILLTIQESRDLILGHRSSFWGFNSCWIAHFIIKRHLFLWLLNVLNQCLAYVVMEV